MGGATLIGWLAYEPGVVDAGEIKSPAPVLGSKEARSSDGEPPAKKPKTEPAKDTAAVASAAAKKNLATYTIEEVRKHSEREDSWIVIEDLVYDVTAFAREHPGGPLPLWGVAGRDATDHFLAFHPSGTQKRLPPLLVGKLVDYTPSETVQDFRALRQHLIDLGLFEIRRSFWVRKFVLFLCLLLGAALSAVRSGSSSSPTAWTMVGAVMLGFFFQQCAGIGHDCGHNSVIHMRRLDRILGLVVGNLLTGISMGWWKKSHNTHHVVPNSIEYDPDIQHLPAFAVSDRYFSSIFSKFHDWTMSFGSVEKFIVGNQHYLYLPIMALARFNLYAQSIIYMVGINSHTHPVQWRVAEVASFLAFLGWMTGLCLCLPSGWHILLFLLVSHSIAGLLHVQITISHFSMSTYDGRAYRNDEESWLHTQLATTMDVICPECLDWFHIGLQFQIEHHLFPRIPRHNLRQVQKLMVPFCKKHGIHHHNVPWLQSIRETLHCLRTVALKARVSDPLAIRFKDTMLYAGLQAEG